MALHLRLVRAGQAGPLFGRGDEHGLAATEEVARGGDQRVPGGRRRGGVGKGNKRIHGGDRPGGV